MIFRRRLSKTISATYRNFRGNFTSPMPILKQCQLSCPACCAEWQRKCWLPEARLPIFAIFAQDLQSSGIGSQDAGGVSQALVSGAG